MSIERARSDRSMLRRPARCQPLKRRGLERRALAGFAGQGERPEACPLMRPALLEAIDREIGQRHNRRKYRPVPNAVPLVSARIGHVSSQWPARRAAEDTEG